MQDPNVLFDEGQELWNKNPRGEDDEKKTVSLWREASSMGHAGAQTSLGCAYQKGVGVERDEREAFLLFESAAKQNHAEAQNQMGVAFEKGLGVGKDPVAAFHWYERAARQNHAGAQTNLGRCYEIGIHVTPVTAKAFHWYTAAAKGGDARGHYNLARCYADGFGTEPSEILAFQHFKESAEAGYVEAMNECGSRYRYGQAFDENKEVKDLEKSFKYYERAAKKGDASAQLIIGTCYQNGQGVKEDAEKMAYWYEKSAGQGYDEAQYLLGRYYNRLYKEMKGEEHAAELRQRATEWFQKAAKNGHARALEMLENPNRSTPPRGDSERTPLRRSLAVSSPAGTPSCRRTLADSFDSSLGDT